MRLKIEALREKGIKALSKHGLNENEAIMIIDSMLSADMSGVHTHGIKMLPAYIEKIERGEFSNSEVIVTKQTAAFTVVNAMNTIGAISASKCVEIAIDKAKTSGVHIVFSNNCNTFGPGFFYAEKISESNMIGLICSNSPAAMPVNNGMECMLGTNPIAFSCPSKSKGNILIDMSTSVVAKSKILSYKNNGEMIPEGWALDKNGKSTTDPVEALNGFVLPMGGVKGYALSLMIDVIAGLLSGSGYLNKVGKFYSKDGKPMNVGHAFMALDPLQIYEGDFLAEMDEYIDCIRCSKAIPGKIISIPGDRKYEERKKSHEFGIELDEQTEDKLNILFDEN